MKNTESAIQNSPQDAASLLGTESTGRLLFRYSVPAITGLVVHALYVLVDRIFIGRWVSEIALGGLSLVMPLLTVSFAFSMLFGVGAANMISMRLGQGRREEAENALNHCFFLLAGIGVLLTAVGLIFLEQILSLMGASEGSAALEFARDYFRIILFGTVFSTVGFGLAHCARAQGFPGIAMIAMIMGAGLNIVLSALFIIVFGWGIEGAAWATVVSQFVSAVWIVSFSLGKKAVIHFRPKTFRPSLRITLHIMMFGSAQALLQFLMSGVQLLLNASMGWYGAAALGVENGGDIALAGMTIISSVIMMALMPVFGISQGAQPILGYNYGAKKFDRVFGTYLKAVSSSIAICIIGAALGVFFPEQMIRAFASDAGPEFTEFAARAMWLMMIVLPLSGFQIISANFFVVTGRPKVSIFFTLLRQCIALIPCMLIFGRVWGLWGVVAAIPVADGFAFLVTGIVIVMELRKLKKAFNINAKEKTQ